MPTHCRNAAEIFPFSAKKILKKSLMAEWENAEMGEGLEKEAMGSEAASPFTSVAQSLVLKNE